MPLPSQALDTNKSTNEFSLRLTDFLRGNVGALTNVKLSDSQDAMIAQIRRCEEDDDVAGGLSLVSNVREPPGNGNIFCRPATTGN